MSMLPNKSWKREGEEEPTLFDMIVWALAKTHFAQKFTVTDKNPTDHREEFTNPDNIWVPLLCEAALSAAKHVSTFTDMSSIGGIWSEGYWYAVKDDNVYQVRLADEQPKDVDAETGAGTVIQVCSARLVEEDNSLGQLLKQKLIDALGL